MIHARNHLLSLATIAVVSLATSQSSHAHFLWLKTVEHEGQPRAYLLFGETPSDEAYHMPEALLKADIFVRNKDGKREKLETKPLEDGDRVGLTAPLESDDTATLETTHTYGIYHKALLTYYAKHVNTDVPKKLNGAGPSKELKLDIVPQLEGKKLQLTVTCDGKPLEGSEVSMRVGDGESVEKETDKNGRVEFELQGQGLVSVLANYIEKDAAGEFEGDEYKSIMHYGSLTFGPPASAKSKSAEQAKPEKAADDDDAANSEAALVPLPEPVSSFGAAVADGWLYVYGGHIGGEHQHSAANLSQFFRRIKLDGSTEWEELPMQTPLQGLALAAHGGKVYRVGGLNARNATKEEDEDLHSTADFSVFDPATGKWESLASLPAPRSSHNAVVIDGKLYVAGGWHLRGSSPGTWQPDALVYDFANPDAGWQKLPEPSFKRRAIAIGNWHGKLVVAGGMDENAKVSRRVDIFDPQSGTWTEGPRLPGTGMMGFGGAACDIDGEIYVTGLQGVVYRLNESGSAWEEATRMTTARFFHQLVPTSDGRLLAVGGASRTDHLADIEAIEVEESDHRL